jgi:hypothetical protein
MKNHSSPEPAAHSTLWAHIHVRIFGKYYNRRHGCHFRALRQRSEQYLTPSQTLSHFFRHAKGRKQAAQTFCGRSAFSMRFDMGAVLLHFRNRANSR